MKLQERFGQDMREIGVDPLPARSTSTLDVTIPTWRWDTETETDISEEVARLHGYENIARTVPTGNEAGGLSDYQKDRRLVRDVLVGRGLPVRRSPCRSWRRVHWLRWAWPRTASP